MGYTTSTVHGIQVPNSAEANDVPEDIGKVVTALEGGSIIRRLTGAAIAALTAPQKPAGLLVYNTTTNKLQISDGTNFADVDATAVSALGIANAALPKAGGTMSGAIAMGGQKVTGLAAGTASSDAATKAQVDAASSVAAAALPKAGGTMAGPIEMGSQKVTGLAKGTANGDAVARQQIQSGNTGTINHDTYGSFSFSPAFGSPPVVVFSLTGVSNAATADIYVYDVTVSGGKIFNSSGFPISANWIAVGN